MQIILPFDQKLSCIALQLCPYQTARTALTRLKMSAAVTRCQSVECICAHLAQLYWAGRLLFVFALVFVLLVLLFLRMLIRIPFAFMPTSLALLCFSAICIAVAATGMSAGAVVLH